MTVNKKFTIIAATPGEIQPLLAFLEKSAKRLSPSQFEWEGKKIDMLITGIGILQTMYALMDYLQTQLPDAWVQLGIGGAFDRSLNVDGVYLIENESLPDFGAQDKNGTILSPFELGWMKANEFPYKNEKLNCPYAHLIKTIPLVSGMTTIHAHGEKKMIEQLRSGSHGQIESMEGAAFFYVSLMKNIPFLSIRSISNFVEPRQKENWSIEKAIQNLNEVFLNEMSDDLPEKLIEQKEVN